MASDSRHPARRRALARLGALVALALVIATATVLVAARGAAEPDARSSAPTAKLSDIPQDGIALGSPDAPATLIEFADLQCPYCATYSREVLPTVIDRYVRSGRLRLELRVLAFLGEDSVRAGRMAGAAARQDRLWPFADRFYREQGTENSGYATDDFLRRIAAATPGLDVDKAFRDRRRLAAGRMLDDADALASDLRADFTPAFYLRHGDGPARPVTPAALTPSAVTAAVDAALAAR